MKPLLSLDIETTGTNITRDHIIQVGLYSPFEVERDWLIRPPVDIPPEITELTGITNEQVAKAWTFKLCASDILAAIQGADLLVFNGYSFDVPFLYEEFARAGITWDLAGVEVIDVGNLCKILNPRDLKTMFLQYCGHEHKDAHGALPDACATYGVFRCMQRQHKEAMQPINVLARQSRYDEDRLSFDGKIILKDGKACFGFGKHEGRAVLEDDSTIGYATWMLREDFPAQTKAVVRKVLEKV